jgi:NuA3 HAT complex component NTO1
MKLICQPWTASSTSKDQSEEEKAVKLKVRTTISFNAIKMNWRQFLTMLRNDLDKVRMLAELTRKREKEKLKQAQVIKDIVDSFIFPAYGKLRLTLQKISASVIPPSSVPAKSWHVRMDRQDLFLHFVSRVEVPDYYEVIKEPMCWTLIDEKIEQNEYRRIEDFKVDLTQWNKTDKQHDINLVLDNALKYNAPDSTFHRIAKRIQANSREFLAELDQLSMPALHADLINGDSGHEEIGDLEPSRNFLEVLISQSGDSHHRDRLASLFAFDLEPPKEPTPPPPPPVAVKKRENYADRKRKWEEKEARHLERLESGRSTRAGQAKEEAFQHEAGLLPPLPAAPQAEAGPSRRTRHSMGNSTSEVSRTLDSSSSNAASRPVRSQVGVAGREIIERLSDKERRAREQGLNLEIEAVDNSDQFTRFNTGWILPEGSSRRKPNDSPAVPLKPRVRKRELIPVIVINRSW